MVGYSRFSQPKKKPKIYRRAKETGSNHITNTRKIDENERKTVRQHIKWKLIEKLIEKLN